MAATNPPAPDSNRSRSSYPTPQFEAWLSFLRGDFPEGIAHALGRSAPWTITQLERRLANGTGGLELPQEGLRAKLADEVNLIRQAAWSGWQRSQQDHTKLTTKTIVGGPGGGREEETHTSEPQSGDPSFLRVILECNRREAVLRGLEKTPPFLVQVGDSADAVDLLLARAEAALTDDQQALRQLHASQDDTTEATKDEEAGNGEMS